MQRLFSILRDVVWTSVLAVVFSAASIITSLVAGSDAVGLTLAFGLSAVVSAILSYRA